ncbi:MAG: type III secretion system chaperone [Janthinobacterium lividum]
MKLDRLSRMLEEVGVREGISDLRFGHENRAVMPLAGGLRLCFEYNEAADLLFLHMSVIELVAAPAQRCAMLETMLSLNFLKLGTCKGELSLQQQGTQAVYQIGLPTAALNVDRLNGEIKRFLAQHRECRQALEDVALPAMPSAVLTRANGHAELLRRLAR